MLYLFCFMWKLLLVAFLGLLSASILNQLITIQFACHSLVQLHPRYGFELVCFFAKMWLRMCNVAHTLLSWCHVELVMCQTNMRETHARDTYLIFYKILLCFAESCPCQSFHFRVTNSTVIRFSLKHVFEKKRKI